jgi:hypothetical protein
VKRMTFKTPEDDQRTLVNDVTGKGGGVLLKVIQRAIENGKIYKDQVVSSGSE